MPIGGAWEPPSVLGEGGGTGNEYLCVEPQRPCEGSRMNMWDVLKAFKPLTVPREALRLEVIFFPLKLITILRVGELELMEMFKPLGVEFRHLSFASCLKTCSENPSCSPREGLWLPELRAEDADLGERSVAVPRCLAGIGAHKEA